MNRAAGIYLHPTSLPSDYGIGDLGPEAYNWINMLSYYKQKIWQISPIGPTGYGFSPYLTLSSFAGNPLLISPDKLFEYGLLNTHELDKCKHDEMFVNFSIIEQKKKEMLDTAFSKFSSNADFEEFCQNNNLWLNDFALFMTLKEIFKNAPWYKWPKEFRLRLEPELDKIRSSYSNKLKYHKFVQWLFYKQWFDLKKYANEKGIMIFGDIPYYTAYDSCDAWAEPDIFLLDKTAKPKKVGGVPPDYFSAEGQLWGNPIYNWKKMKKNKFSWWKKRLGKATELFDLIRIDHFRGLEAYWAVPYGEKTAINGKWIKGPGYSFFVELKKDLPDIKLIAEDLGHITEEVHKLRKKTGIPGMKVLQFAFDGNKNNPYLPYNTDYNSVCYTGTHDNDTSIGWFNSLDTERKQYICSYLGCNEHEFADKFLRLAYQSCAYITIIPFQDILELDSEHRMNTPGTGEGNWRWRYFWHMADQSKLERMAYYTELYGRY